MTLQFPNVSRSFDAARDCVRFSCYDHTREVAFFIAGDAIRGVDGGHLPDAESLLSAFDRNRDRICRRLLAHLTRFADSRARPSEGIRSSASNRSATTTPTNQRMNVLHPPALCVGSCIGLR